MYRNRKSKLVARRTAMKLLRFALIGLCGLAVFFCALALGRLVGLGPPNNVGAYPNWMAIHFVCGAVFAAIAPLQLWPWLRARRPGLHRALGRIGVAVGATMAVSGIAVVHLSPGRPISERIFMTTFFVAYAVMLAL